MSAELVADHLSSRWDRPASTLALTLADSARVARVITVTEVAREARARALRLPDWTVSRDPRGDLGEVAILAHSATWETLEARTYVLGPDLGPGGRVVGMVAVLRHRESGLKLVVGTAHFPAAVESSWTARGRRVVAYLAAVQQLRRAVLRTRRRHGAAAAYVAADWNLNAYRAWVRRWIRAAWPGLRLPARLPPGGTHGRRLIDWPITRGIDRVAFTIRPDPHRSSDHMPIRTTGRIPG